LQVTCVLEASCPKAAGIPRSTVASSAPAIAAVVILDFI
jgi:hypothetical protein